jgi:hypothetical protein
MVYLTCSASGGIVWPDGIYGMKYNDDDDDKKPGPWILQCGISRTYANHHRFNFKKPCTRREMTNDKFSINKYFIINFRLECTKSHAQHCLNKLIFS